MKNPNYPHKHARNALHIAMTVPAKNAQHVQKDTL